MAHPFLNYESPVPYVPVFRDTMTIRLTQDQINKALPKLHKGLEQYLRLRDMVADSPEFYLDEDFRRRFCHFYRVRRGPEWRDKFFRLMGRTRNEGLDFQAILSALRDDTGRYEASFASKLAATLDTSKPVIDSIVLGNLGLRLPSRKAASRLVGICQVYRTLIKLFVAFLRTDAGEYLVKEFERKYPDKKISKVKMLDLVLWQTRI
jgi:hypothetical protein